MMLHEKMSEQFYENAHTNVLHTIHRHTSQSSQSPPMTAVDMDFYTYNRQLQQMQQMHQYFIGSHTNTTGEVLDLSRRCDSVETPNKTPSPSNFCSPATSPTSSQQQPPAPKQLSPIQPGSLLYSAQASRYNQQLPVSSSLLYYPNEIKQEHVLTTTTPPLPPAVASPQHHHQLSPAPSAYSPKSILQPATNSLLQTFAATAAIAATAALSGGDISLPVTTSPLRSPVLAKYPPTAIARLANGSGASAALVVPPPANDVKPTRPFKAFPRDPIVLAANFTASDVLLDNKGAERYAEYRKRVYEQIYNANGDRTVTNPKMRRFNTRSTSISESGRCENGGRTSSLSHHSEGAELSDCDSNCDAKSSNSRTEHAGSNATTNDGAPIKDAAYYERRRKNNAAAKKSRDRRRIKEDEIAIRAAYLERQNIELLCENDVLRAQLASRNAVA